MTETGTAIIALSELAKLGLQAYFAAMRGQGKTDEEIDQMYRSQQAEFIAKHPSTLTPPPPLSDEPSGPGN